MFEAAKLDLVILITCPRVIRLILEQLRPRSQLVTAHRGKELNAARCLAEAGRLVEGQVIDRNDLGRGAKRNAIPAQKPRNLQIARLRNQAYEDKRRVC